MQLFLSEQLRLLFISQSGAFNQNPFSALHFSQAEYATVPLIIGQLKGSFTQKMKDKGNVRVKVSPPLKILMALLSLFVLVYCINLLSRDIAGLLSRTYCQDLKICALLKV